MGTRAYRGVAAVSDTRMLWVHVLVLETLTHRSFTGEASTRQVAHQVLQRDDARSAGGALRALRRLGLVESYRVGGATWWRPTALGYETAAAWRQPLEDAWDSEEG